MSGRLHALAAAVVLGLLTPFAWTSVAVVALVALRRGAVDALWPMAGALTVALALHWNSGDVSQLGAVLAGTAGALVLANSRSLALAMVTVSLAAGLYLALLLQWAPERFDQLASMLAPFFDELKQASPQPLLAQVDPRQIVVEGMGLVTALSAQAALILARWLQARLYNPGGFRAEFHSLRLTRPMTVALAMGMLITQWFSAATVLLPMLVLPLALAGLGLVHGLAARRRVQTVTPLVFFYLTLVLLAGPAFMVLMAAAVMDSFIDFRKRIGTARP
ncbi:MAG TPA: hypothetical protein VM553_20555 [Dongiaceae bacterium]|nr:hypothetical protein [Dongiaceae bacterium]